MAVNENVNINVSDNGSLNKVTKDAKTLGAEIEKIGASSTRIPKALAAAKAGMQSMNAVGGQIGQESSTARGIGGMTGAAGRDFAAQAQGLGGLVHVYATFAANLFAISAAFSALSKAADTTNMVKGLDQLGAAAGRGLGSLAKRLSEVTDGAISMRDAMTATAQASAGGMSGENILRLGKVAKQASQALGIDMPNAVSRLSRGITKLEPELLDEIGIMVRVDRASEEYARTLGKSAAALTDFEKRQGFANAVLEQGEKKFGAIDLAANPYSKILASIQNLSQAGLELLNKVLGPLLNALASSPTALGLAIGGIATLLLKQAIPSITAWRENLDASAASARKAAIAANELRKGKILEGDLQLYEKQQKAIVSTTKAMADLNAMKTTAKTKSLLLNVDPNTATKEQADALAKQAEARGKLKILEEGASNRSIVAAKNAQLEAAGIRNVVAEINKRIAAEQLLNNLEKNVTKSGKLAEFFSQDAARNRIADRLQAASRRADIVSQIGQNLPVKGTIESFKALTKAISDARNGSYTLADGAVETGKKMSIVGAAATGLRGSLAILTSTITTLVSSVFGWLAAFGLLVAGFQLLDGWLTTSSKQNEEYTTSLDMIAAAAENVDRTLENIWSKDTKDILSTESIQARANAFNELSQSVAKSAKDFDKLTMAWSWWDKSIDWVKDGFGAGAADKLATGLSRSIISSLKIMEEGPAKDAAKKSIENLIGSDIDVSNFDAVETALRKLTDRDIAVKASEISKQLGLINREINNSAAPLTAFTNNMVEVNKTIADIGTSLKATDNLTKLGSQLTTMGFQFTEAIKNPTTAIAALKEIINSTSQLSLLDPNLSNELLSDKTAINEISTSIGEYSKSLAKAKEEHSKLMEEINKEGGLGSSRLTGAGAIPQAEKLLTAEAAARSSVENLTTLLNKANADSTGFLEKYANRINISLFEKGSQLLVDSLKGAWELAGITIAKASLSILSAAGGNTAKFEADLARQEIDIQIKLIESQFDLIKAIKENTLQQQINLAQTELSKNQRLRDIEAPSITDPVLQQRVRTDAIKEINRLTPQLEALMSGISIVQKSDKSSIAKYQKLSLEGTPEEKLMLASLTDYFERLFGKTGQIAKLQAGKAAIGAQEFLQNNREKARQRETEVNKRIGEDTSEIEALKLEQEFVKVFDERLFLRKRDIELHALNLRLQEEEDKAQDRVLIAEEAKRRFSNASEQERAEANKALRSAIALRDAAENKSLQERAAKEALLNSERRRGIEALDTRQREYSARVAKDEADSTEVYLKNQEAKLDIINRLDVLSKSDVLAKKASIDLIRQESSIEQERMAFDIESSKQIQLIINDIAEAEARRAGSGKARQEDLDRLVASLAIQRSNMEALAAQKRENLMLDTEINIRLAKQAELMEKLVSISEDLGNAFGAFGAALGETLKGLVKLANRDENYLATRKVLMKEVEEAEKNNDSTTVLNKLKEINKLENKNKKDQIRNITDVAGASKKMFKEKTAAYKILDSIEKVSSAISIANTIKENAAELMTLPGKIAGGVAKIFSSLGPFGFPVAAAFLALMASLGFGKGSSASSPAGSTAEDQQAVQGTGQSYVNGRLVDNGGGKLGDAKAVSTTIVDGIDRLEKVYFEMLDFEKGRTYQALIDIRDNTFNMAKGLGVSTGLIGGVSAFGTVEGSKSVLGGLTSKSVKVLDKGIELAGTLNDLGLGMGTRNIYETVKKSSSYLWGLGSSSSTKTKRSPIDNEAVNNAISDIFGSMQEVLLSSAEALGASQSNVLDAIRTTNLTLKVSSKDLSGEEFAEAVMAEIGIQLDIAATKAFPQLKVLQDKFQNFGESTADFLIRIVNDQKQVQLAFDSIGKSFSDITVSAQMVSGAFNIFGGAIGSILKQLSTYSFTRTISKAEISQILIEASGGLDEFVSNIESFGDNFLTEAERLAPIQTALTKRLSELGYASVDTREEFKQLIRTFQFTSESSIKTYAELLALSDAFNEVYPEIKKVTSAEELRTQKLSQYIEILKLQEKTGEALILQRLEELSAMDDSLKAGQLYLYALQDEATVKAKLKTAYDKEKAALNSTITAITNSIKALNEYKTSLLGSANSTLTPLQKYEESKSQFQQTALLASGPALTEEEKKAKEDAINKLPTVSNTFLEASRTMFASSAQYTADFNTVLDLVASTSASLDVQLSTAEQQLLELEQSVSFLSFIEQNTETTAQLLFNYAHAQSVTAKAQADYSMNLNMMTAELISRSGLTNSLLETMLASIQYNAPSMTLAAANAPDYWTSPVAPAAPTMSIPESPTGQFTIFSGNDATITELQAIRAELEKLRAEQQAQTGDIIATNYDATAKTAEELAAIAEQQAINDAWNNRLFSGYDP